MDTPVDKAIEAAADRITANQEALYGEVNHSSYANDLRREEASEHVVAFLRVLLDHPGHKRAASQLLTALGE